MTTSVTRQPSDRRPDSSSSSHHHHHHSHGSVGSTSGASVDFQSPAVGEIGETGAPVADRPSHERFASYFFPLGCAFNWVLNGVLRGNMLVKHIKR